MPKPQRCRRICHEPEFINFSSDGTEQSEIIQLSIDEFEVIRLVDLEKRTHQECAKQMDISRTTVTEIYEKARYKLADYLIHGKHLMIEGGHYRLCDGSAQAYCQKRCYREMNEDMIIIAKGEKIMRIAVTYEDGMIFQHFGHTSKFKLYDIEDGHVVESRVVDTNGSGHGALASFLVAQQVQVLICGGIGGGAKNALSNAGIELFGGVSGNADEVVENYLNNTLEYNPNIQCSHHSHDHNCGDHSCKSHDCHH